ncbi:MAG: cysteine-rich CWC family protein [Cyclobacteriaceae bacterium]|nr:cysteine-rich CWC family protein [Cyclobacteriaceae bacterium]
MKAQTKTCPECGKMFECSNNNILNCRCIEVMLSSTARRQIAEKYRDCLCPECLRQVAAQFP